MCSEHGFTLWELIWTIALAAVIAVLGIPSMQRFVLDQRRTADVNGFVTSVQLARSEAAKRHRLVVLCSTQDGSACTDTAAGYQAGWMVFANDDAERPPARDPGEDLIFAWQPEIDGTIRSNRSYFEFRPFLRRSTNGTVTFCDRRGAAAARAVIVSYTGRPRTSAQGPARRLSCAEFP